VSLSAEVRGQDGAEHAAVMNMSASGALVDLGRPVVLGEPISLRIEVPGMSTVETQGHVARVDGTRVGVAFDEVGEHDAELMSYHVMGRRQDA
jgi:hypothetical protein